MHSFGVVARGVGETTLGVNVDTNARWSPPTTPDLGTVTLPDLDEQFLLGVKIALVAPTGQDRAGVLSLRTRRLILGKRCRHQRNYVGLQLER